MFISQDFQALSTDDMNWIPSTYSLTKNDLLSNEFTYIYDKSKDRYYLIIYSNTNNIIQLKGKKALYPIYTYYRDSKKICR